MVDRTKNPQPAARPKKQPVEPAENLTAILSQKVVGQPAATKVIVPYIQMFQAGLAPEGRPVGVFLLLGPTGTGKTKTVEALAEILHGSEKNRSEGRLRRISDGARGGQADRRAARLSGTSRNPADADAAEAERGDQRPLRAFAGAVRRNREGRAFADAPAAGRARQRRPALGRQFHGQLREEPGIPDQQPGRAGDDEGDQSRLRLSAPAPAWSGPT